MQESDEGLDLEALFNTVIGKALEWKDGNATPAANYATDGPTRKIKAGRY